MPYLATHNTDSQARAVDLLDQLGTSPDVVRDDDPRRVTEVWSTEAGPALGRLLGGLGAPTSGDNWRRRLLLPAWVFEAPLAVPVGLRPEVS